MVKSMLGGETHRNSLNYASGYSKKAQPSYLEPNSSSMQKPIEALSLLALPELHKAPLNKGGYRLFQATEHNHPTPTHETLSPQKT
jgi:hypothetical protein